MVRNVNVNVKVDSCFTLSCELFGRLPNIKRWKLSTAHMPGRLRVVGEVKSVSWGGARTKGEAHKRELTLLHSDLLTSVSSSLTQLFFTIKKLAMRTNGINIYSTINQSYCIICTFDLRRTLPKYIRTFLHKNAVLTIGLTDQSGYSICLLYGKTFHTYSMVKSQGEYIDTVRNIGVDLTTCVLSNV